MRPSRRRRAPRWRTAAADSTLAGLRVLHVIGSTAPRYGGPSVAVRRMAAGLHARGAHVAVASTNADGPSASLDVPLGRPVVEGGVEYWHFARTMPGEWKLSLPLTRWLFAHARDYDVVHVHAAFTYTTFAGCRAAWRAGVPYVLRPLGTLDPWSLGQRSWKKRPYYALVERAHLERAAAVHVTAESEAAAIARLGFAGKTAVIPNGVDLPDAPLAERAPHEGPLRLIFLSRLHPKKELPLIFRAVRQVTDAGVPVRLTVAGTGEPAYEAELRTRVHELALKDVVSFVGHVEGAAKWAAFADADVYLLPSRQENFGIAVAEALAAGLPVIVSDQVAIAGDVAAAGAGEMIPVDADALARAIARLARDAGARLAMGRRAAAFARERYSWDRASDGILALYERILRAPDARTGRRSA